MKPKDADKDTVEKIVADAVAREKRINKLHPESHGYGMVEGEADDLIRRIEELERKQLQAQAKSSSRRREKIRLVGMDKLYTHGPEEIVIEQEEKEEWRRKNRRVLRKLPPPQGYIYARRIEGFTQVEISKELKVSQTTVSRRMGEATQTIKKMRPA